MSKGRCYICDSDLVYDPNLPGCNEETQVDVEGYSCKSIICQTCATEYDCFVPDEPVKNIDVVNYQGFGLCPFCGGILCWSGDFMRSEMDNKDYADDDDAIVRSLICSNCGADIMVNELTPNEMKRQPFYKLD